MSTLILISILIAVVVICSRRKTEQPAGEIVITASVEKPEPPPLPEPEAPRHPELDMQPDWMSEKQWDAYCNKLDRRREAVDKKAAAIIDKIEKAYDKALDKLSQLSMYDQITEEQYHAEWDRMDQIHKQLLEEAEAEASVPPVPLPTPRKPKLATNTNK